MHDIKSPEENRIICNHLGFLLHQVTSEFPNLKINKKSVSLAIFGYNFKATMPKQAGTLLEAAQLAECHRKAALHLWKSIDKTKKCLDSRTCF